jgi:hypothetical protein
LLCPLRLLVRAHPARGLNRHRNRNRNRNRNAVSSGAKIAAAGPDSAAASPPYSEMACKGKSDTDVCLAWPRGTKVGACQMVEGYDVLRCVALPAAAPTPGPPGPQASLSLHAAAASAHPPRLTRPPPSRAAQGEPGPAGAAGTACVSIVSNTSNEDVFKALAALQATLDSAVAALKSDVADVGSYLKKFCNNTSTAMGQGFASTLGGIAAVSGKVDGLGGALYGDLSTFMTETDDLMSKVDDKLDELFTTLGQHVSG